MPKQIQLKPVQTMGVEPESAVRPVPPDQVRHVGVLLRDALRGVRPPIEVPAVCDGGGRRPGWKAAGGGRRPGLKAAGGEARASEKPGGWAMYGCVMHGRDGRRPGGKAPAGNHERVRHPAGGPCMDESCMGATGGPCVDEPCMGANGRQSTELAWASGQWRGAHANACGGGRCGVQVGVTGDHGGGTMVSGSLQ